MTAACCPALFLTAPASGQGKTTITAALARQLKREGKLVRVFKTGPDYLDPQILQQASGQPVEQLDMWMAGAAYCQQKLYEAARTADLILIEGVMGMFDGEPSSADLAARFNIPMAIVMDVRAMAQTAAAIAAGLANHRTDVSVVGLIANNCGTQRHRQLIEDALPAEVPMLAALERSDAVALPERHLGLVQAAEISEQLEHSFAAGADWIKRAGLSQAIRKIPSVKFTAAQLPELQPLLSGIKLGVAKDAAFSFIYQSNLELLRDMGASITFFSPISDQKLPEVDALWLPGGYPELHAQALAENQKMITQIKEFFGRDKPILAECGGFLYCLQTLTDLNEQQHTMSGLLKGHGAMRGKRGCQGMQTAPLPEGEVRAHAHHRSLSSYTPKPIAFGRRQRHAAAGEAIYRQRQLTATFLHLYFPSNPQAVAHLFGR